MVAQFLEVVAELCEGQRAAHDARRLTTRRVLVCRVCRQTGRVAEILSA
jgi:hypothetical protein